jgi:hypothetical protein
MVSIIAALYQWNRSHLINRILVQGLSEAELQPAGIRRYVEDLKRGSNIETGPRCIFLDDL